MEENIKVKKFVCKCGKARMLSVIDPNGRPLTKDQIKDHTALFKAGCDIQTISLEEARNTELCFDCKL